MSHPLLVFGDAVGRYLIARIDPEAPRLFWPTWCVDDRGMDGPRSLGCWLKFTPSDWRPSPGPIPAHVHRAAEWIASIADLDQVGVRDGEGWMPRHPGGASER